MYATSIWCTEQSACTKLLTELKALHAKLKDVNNPGGSGTRSGSSTTPSSSWPPKPGDRVHAMRLYQHDGRGMYDMVIQISTIDLQREIITFKNSEQKFPNASLYTTLPLKNIRKPFQAGEWAFYAWVPGGIYVPCVVISEMDDEFKYKIKTDEKSEVVPFSTLIARNDPKFRDVFGEKAYQWERDWLKERPIIDPKVKHFDMKIKDDWIPVTITQDFKVMDLNGNKVPYPNSSNEVRVSFTPNTKVLLYDSGHAIVLERRDNGSYGVNTHTGQYVVDAKYLEEVSAGKHIDSTTILDVYTENVEEVSVYEATDPERVRGVKWLQPPSSSLYYSSRSTYSPYSSMM
jgi:hypothetical protein